MLHCFKFPQIKRLPRSSLCGFANAGSSSTSCFCSWRQSYVTNYKITKNKNHICGSCISQFAKFAEQIILQKLPTCIKTVNADSYVLFDSRLHRQVWKELTSDFIREHRAWCRSVCDQRVSNDFLGLSRDLSVDAPLISGFIIESLRCSVFNLVEMTKYEKNIFVFIVVNFLKGRDNIRGSVSG